MIFIQNAGGQYLFNIRLALETYLKTVQHTTIVKLWFLKIQLTV